MSARLTISAMENLVSNAERRALLLGDTGRSCRVSATSRMFSPGLTGKIELVFEGEQEGPTKVSKALVGKAVRETFRTYFPDPLRKRPRPSQPKPKHVNTTSNTERSSSGLRPATAWSFPTHAGPEYCTVLESVHGLRAFAERHLPTKDRSWELPSVMEFVLDGLHQNSRIAKDELDHRTSYKDLVGSIFSGRNAPSRRNIVRLICSRLASGFCNRRAAPRADDLALQCPCHPDQWRRGGGPGVAPPAGSRSTGSLTRTSRWRSCLTSCKEMGLH